MKWSNPFDGVYRRAFAWLPTKVYSEVHFRYYTIWLQKYRWRYRYTWSGWILERHFTEEQEEEHRLEVQAKVEYWQKRRAREAMELKTRNKKTRRN